MDRFQNHTELSPLAAAVAEDIIKYNMIRFGDRVVTGISGGPDSVCLLSILAELRTVLGIRSLHAVHVNHGLRGAESDQDQSYAETVARSMDVTFDAVYFDVHRMAEEQCLGEEEMGRKLRYSVFELYRQKYGAQRIAVAHNRNDQAETVMMRLLRGTGLRGIAGIDRIRSDGIVIRPLLGIQRKEIEEYCRLKGLKPHTDSTNLMPVHTRNRIRLNLFPLMEKEYNPRLQDALIRLAEQAAETEEYFRQIVTRYLDEEREGSGTPRWNPEDSSLDMDGFEDLHKAVSSRVVLVILERIGAENNITSDTIRRIIRTALSEKEPSETDIHNGCYVRKMYGRLWFLKREQEESRRVREPVPLPLEQLESFGTAELQAGGLRINLFLSDNREQFVGCSDRNIIRAYLDYNQLILSGVPYFRNRRPGDRFRPIGMLGRKKIQDYFTDRKIPRQNRDTAILLAEGNEVFFVEGEVSGECAVTEETRRILTIQYEKEWKQDRL
ncbi:MAG: tRNA lysidine(34) synthetase TilS [Lachnospiraceae bacterium]|nr:tRNA lysidine(34) synthetase TilS [Lachnospiraceae bacterium]